MRRLPFLIVVSVVLLSLLGGCGVLEQRYKAAEAQANASSSQWWSLGVQAKASADASITADRERTERLEALMAYLARDRGTEGLVADGIWEGLKTIIAVLILLLLGGLVWAIWKRAE